MQGNGAQERTRTSTSIRTLAPEASASTNSATWAGVVGWAYKMVFRGRQTEIARRKRGFQGCATGSAEAADAAGGVAISLACDTDRHYETSGAGVAQLVEHVIRK
ncbi:hypothetical protein RBY4I_2583 [Rhodobacterales bacterium Y4I]|nr:hypothetical protein RBY4I_2583 [Rhodobacterales bacterium Y4I]